MATSLQPNKKSQITNFNLTKVSTDHECQQKNEDTLHASYRQQAFQSIREKEHKKTPTKKTNKMIHKFNPNKLLNLAFNFIDFD